MLSLDEQNEWRERYRRQHPDWRPATEVYADMVRGALRPSSLLLDVGCGRGGLVEQLDHPLCQMVGLDPDWRSLREHRLALPRVTAVSDGLPFATASFDLIFASWVLEHLADPAPTFAEMGRVLKPGGAFVFITPNGRHPLTLLNRGLGRFSRIQGYVVERFYGRAPTDTFPTFYRANSATTIQKLCQQNKLVLETLHAISDPTYLAFNQSLFRLMCQIEDKLPASRKLHLVGLARKK